MAWLTYFYDVLSWNLKLSEGNRLVSRRNRDGQGLVYMTDELGEDESCSFRVEGVDPLLDATSALSLMLGLTTCDSSIVANFPSHVIEPCQPSHDCMGQTLTVKVRSAHRVHDEVSVQRQNGGRLQVLVNGVSEFSLTDPHDSLFPFSKGPAYPFLMLTGSVSQIRATECTRVASSDDSVIEVSDKNSVIGGGTKSCKQRKEPSCIICMDETVSRMAVPCNHAAFCERDADEQMRTAKTCPICRKSVTSFARVFLP